MDTSKVLSRSEMPRKYKWAIEDIFATDAAWEECCAKIKEISSQFAAFEGRLGDNAHNLLNFCQLETKVMLTLKDIHGYANRRYDEDTTNSTYQAMFSQATSVYVEVSSKTAFSSPEILAIPDETLNRFYEEAPELKIYKRSLDDLRRLKDHILSAREENLLAAAAEMADSPGDIFSKLNNADIVYPPVHSDSGEDIQLTSGSFVPLLQNPNRRIRKEAFENVYHTIEKTQNTSAAIINAQINQLKFFANTRKYDSTLQASLSQTNVPVSVYKNLITTVHDNMHYLHKYMELRKKLLKVDELHMYDLHVPMLPDVNVRIDFEDAKKNVLNAVFVLGPKYQAILQEGFNNRWIDVYENLGKRSGAYVADLTAHPFVLLNHKDDLTSEFTLAHEMGHAVHTYLSNQNQPAPDARYVIFVAEVASTCNEALLMQYLLGQTDDKKVRAYLINYFLEQFRNTLYRQTMFAEFEMRINEASENGVGLTADYINKIYHDLNALYYGNNVVIDHEIDVEWARVPHFYYDFYVFQYATGFSAAMALSQRILKEGAPAVADYISFLSSGCSKDPISLLKGAGVDMESPKPIEDALKLFGTLIDELEELMA